MTPPPAEQSLPDAKSAEPQFTMDWLDGFRRQVKQQPGKTAIISGSRQFTFADLEEGSNRIARKLAEAGIGAGHYVGCGFHRSAELITALLGILKSGAAYVPLDPAYPPTRIATMIASAGLKTVVTSPELAPCFPGTKILHLGSSSADKTPALPPAIARRPENPIYAIFTSGSTGQPKAASVFDSGFANLLAWYGRELNLGGSDRTLVISSPSFDLTQKNLFTPLLTGGTLILDDCRTYDITRILGLIAEHAVTLVNCTPSAFYPLVDAASAGGFKDLATLRFAVLGGEPISIPRLRTWLEHPSCHTQVVNSYGPTECTDICLFHRLHRGNLDRFPFVPLGREIPNVEVTVRDENLDILADGETGELCIGGTGVGGGYLNDPERSADRFVNGIYRSGDLAKRLPCGTFEFRGRADHQVKVNGFRIELGEVEIALNSHPDVLESIVTADHDKLTAHIRGAVNAESLRAHLATRLPAYMIPSELLPVTEFPLTPNGKVDRMALMNPPTDLPASPPTTDMPLEARVLSLWSEVLGHPVTDATANFFDVGGNSIHLAVVHVRLRALTGRDFPITDLFAHTSARAISLHLSRRQSTGDSNATQTRARLSRAGFARFQRSSSR